MSVNKGHGDPGGTASQPPRHDHGPDGASGLTKRLRKAQARLAVRQKGYEQVPDSKRRGFRKPGSMSRG